jgi:metal-responsive CopG/Arc/MetJ family transcriptional regulator
MAQEETRIHMLAPSDLAEAFDRTAKAQDLTRSQALRRLMREFVAEHGQTDFVDDGRGRRSRKGAKK